MIQNQISSKDDTGNVAKPWLSDAFLFLITIFKL